MYVRPDAVGAIVKLVYLSTVLAAVPMAPAAKSPNANDVFFVEPLLVKVPVPALAPAVKLPCTVVVVVDLPMTTLPAFVTPRFIALVPLVLVPVSTFTLAAVPLVLLPVWMVIALEVPAFGVAIVTPLPPCKVREPVVVLNVDAAPPVKVRAAPLTTPIAPVELFPIVTVPVEPFPMFVLALPLVFTFVVPVRLEVPLVTEKFLPVVTVVSPFKLTAPVPVLKVPLLAD